MEERRPVIITGMHRSGTSLTASLLQQAGVNIGTELIGPWKGNPRGHFEDIKFHDFHETLLRRRGLSFYVETASKLQAATSAEAGEAQALIDDRQSRGLWGWKDPRTSLFLDLWKGLLPDARFVFVYRHPIDVILSLLRRATDLLPLISPLLALRSWYLYNHTILEFARKYHDQCLLCNAVRLAENTPDFKDLVEERFNLDLNFEDADIIYTSGSLQQLPLASDPRVRSALEVIFPEVPRLYAELEFAANLPSDILDKAPDQDHDLLPGFIRFAKEATRNGVLKDNARSPLFSLLLGLLAPEVMKDLPETIHAETGKLAQDKANYASSLRELSQESTKTKGQLEQLTAEKAKQEKKLENSENRAERLQEELQEQQRESKVRDERSQEELQEQQRESKVRDETNKAEFQEEKNRIERQKHEFESRIEALQEKLAASEKELQKKKKKIQKLKRGTRALQAELHSSQVEIESLGKEKESEIARLLAVTSKLDSKLAEIEILESSLKAKRFRIRDLEGDLQAKRVRIAQQEAELACQSTTLQLIHDSRSWRLVERYWHTNKRIRQFLGRRKQRTPTEPRTNRSLAFVLPNGLNLGGVTIWSVEMASRLLALDRRATLLHHDNPEIGVDFEAPSFVPSIGSGGQKNSWDTTQEDLSQYSADYLKALPALIVPNYNYASYATCALLSMERAEDLRVIGFCHSDETFYYQLLYYYEDIIHKFVCVSAESAKTLGNLLPHRAKDIITLPYAVVAAKALGRMYSPRRRPLRIIYGGRIVEHQKRISRLVDLVRALSESEVDFELRIVGKGDAEEELRTAFAQLAPEAQQRIHMPGFVPPAEMIEAWTGSDVSVLVSDWEGTSISMLESMACGCVPVVPRVSGTAAVVEYGVNGFVTPVGDLDAMVRVLKILDLDRKLLTQMGTRAHATIVERYSYDEYIQNFLKLDEKAWTEQPRKWSAEKILIPKESDVYADISKVLSNSEGG